MGRQTKEPSARAQKECASIRWDQSRPVARIKRPQEELKTVRISVGGRMMRLVAFCAQIPLFCALRRRSLAHGARVRSTPGQFARKLHKKRWLYTGHLTWNQDCQPRAYKQCRTHSTKQSEHRDIGSARERERNTLPPTHSFLSKCLPNWYKTLCISTIRAIWTRQTRSIITNYG